MRGSPDGLAADYGAALAFSGAERGCAVGGHIYATSDGGASWYRQLTPRVPRLLDVVFCGASPGLWR